MSNWLALLLFPSTRISRFGASFASHFERVYILALVFFVITYHTRFTLWRTLRFLHNPIYLLLLVHISSSFTEIFRFSYRSYYEQTIHATFTDFALMLAHSITSYHLAQQNRFRKANRPGLRAQAFTFRVMAGTLGYAFDIPLLHKASVRISNASFIYSRVLIILGRRVQITVRGGTKWEGTESVAAVLGGILALYDAGIPMGPQLYLVSLIPLFALERWVARQMIAR